MTILAPRRAVRMRAIRAISRGEPIMVTIREIAQRAGYSQATVSRLLNGDPTLSVKDDTRRKIIAVSEELGYATQTPRIALPRAVAVLSNFTPDEDLQDAYFNELRDVLELSLIHI